MVTVRSQTREWAAKIWPRVCEDINVQDCFGEEMDNVSPPGEYWLEILDAETTVGMSWVRKFVKTGRAMSVGRGILPEYRRKGYSNAAHRAIFDWIWATFPEAASIYGAAYTTNPISVHNLSSRYPQIGVFPLGDRDLFFYLLEARK